MTKKRLREIIEEIMLQKKGMKEMGEKMHKLYLEEAIVTALLNAFLNGFFAWILNKDAEYVDVSFWVFAVNMFIACHILCFIVVSNKSSSAKKYIEKGAFIESDKLKKMDLPSKVVPLALLLADVFTILSALLVGGALALMGMTRMSLIPFVILRAVMGSVTGCAVGLLALSHYLLKKENKDA